MAEFQTWVHSDLKHMVQAEELNGVLFEKDNNANRIGVILTDNGVPAQVSGSVMGYVILRNGVTEKIAGSISGNRASIVLPSSVYDIEGPVSIVIKLDETTIGACRGYVRKYITDNII